MRYVIEVYRSPDGVHGNVVDEGGGNEDPGPCTPFHGWLELLSLLEPPQEDPATGSSHAADGDSCDA
ncbi:hypothetical protein ACGFSB_33360 [Streptomyces sp. NPDC048441]|uniref:hypothetical protein n=1 Tax=Streptomyces sp. NPDC048441 TaxID=3365552 RepID=UPI003722ABC6